jgi:Family of unknown function (DUF6499)
MPPASNWRSSATYEYVNELDPAEFAWEFLRRNPEYQRDVRTIRREPSPDDDTEASARLWGLRFRGRPEYASGYRLAGLAAPS